MPLLALKGLRQYDCLKSFIIFSEIKALDSDMQTLVYENYNKFISATDTIRKV
jgi:hypothetical protein